MKKDIGSYEAKTRLPELLRQVQKGQRFTITNRGRAIAELIPIPEARKSQALVVKKMKTFMREEPIPDAPIKDLIEEGRA
ncbi:MAG: type II toxin-antitoxin system prevent-host-death family antitoxin [Pseudohongiellaceae bacterium]